MRSEYFNFEGKPYSEKDFDEFFIGKFTDHTDKAFDTIRKYSGKKDTMNDTFVLGMSENNVPFVRVYIQKFSVGDGMSHYRGRVASDSDFNFEDVSADNLRYKMMNKLGVGIVSTFLDEMDYSKFAEGGKAELKGEIHLSVNGNKPITYNEFVKYNTMSSIYMPSPADFHAIKNLKVGETYHFGMGVPVTRVDGSHFDLGGRIEMLSNEIFDAMPYDKPICEMEIALQHDISFPTAQTIMLNLLDEGRVETYADFKFQPNEYQGNFYIKTERAEEDYLMRKDMYKRGGSVHSVKRKISDLETLLEIETDKKTIKELKSRISDLKQTI